MEAECIRDLDALSLERGRLEDDAKNAATLIERAWRILAEMPLRSERTAAEKRAGREIVDAISRLCSRSFRVHADAMYDALTTARTERPRVDDLVWRAGELWPGLVPTKEEVEEESERMQADKDGREIRQGLFVSQLLSQPALGEHLISSMLAPTPAALARVDELVRAGELDLGLTRVVVKDEVGYVYFHQPRYLNAEDDETVAAAELAVDLLLLHPGVRMGVLRGDPVEHPKYPGRRIFSAGINLTKLYHGKVSYLFYLVRDLGFVHKLYRGLAISTSAVQEPETTVEKPWIAVVEAFAIGGGCQLLLVVDRVIAEEGAYFNLPARKEGIIPGAANLRLPRFVGEGVAREAILFDRRFDVSEPQARAIVHEVHPASALDDAVEEAVENAVGSGMVSASGNRKALRVQAEPLDAFRRYMATYARDQADCHLSEQLIGNLERHWHARTREL